MDQQVITRLDALTTTMGETREWQAGATVRLERIEASHSRAEDQAEERRRWLERRIRDLERSSAAGEWVPRVVWLCVCTVGSAVAAYLLWHVQQG